MFNIKKIIQTLYQFFSKNEVAVISNNRKNLKEVNEQFAFSENPLIPYMSPYDSIENRSAFLKIKNVPLTKHEYEEIFKKLIDLKSFVREDKSSILKKIYNDLKVIHDALIPMKKLGIELTLDLTGGAVRDFVLDNHNLISDLDVMISFSDNESSFRLKNKDFEKAGITKEILDKVQWSDRENDTSIIQTKLIQACFEKMNMVETSFLKNKQDRKEPLKIKKDISNEYINDNTVLNRLSGVIKLKTTGLNYKVDLLVTDLTKAIFLDEFDIGLCKASICFLNKSYKKEFPKDYSHLVSRFGASIDFFADIHNKKLTIDVNGKSINMINATINTHLPKVKAKYPQYEVNFVNTNIKDKESLKNAKSQYFASQLDSVLGDKKDKNKRIKI